MGPLSFIPAVLKAQFHLLRLLRSILHKKEWTARYSTIAGIAISIIILLSIWKMWILLGNGIYWSLQEIYFLSTWQGQFEMENSSSEISWNLTFSILPWILVWWYIQEFGWRVFIGFKFCAEFVSCCTIGQSKTALFSSFIQMGEVWDAGTDAVKMHFEESWKFCKRLLCSKGSIDRVNESFVCARTAG